MWVRNIDSYQLSVVGTGESFILPVQLSLYYSEVLVKGPGHGLRIEDVLAALREGRLICLGHLVKLLLKEATYERLISWAFSEFRNIKGQNISPWQNVSPMWAEHSFTGTY